MWPVLITKSQSHVVPSSLILLPLSSLLGPSVFLAAQFWNTLRLCCPPVRQTFTQNTCSQCVGRRGSYTLCLWLTDLKAITLRLAYLTEVAAYVSTTLSRWKWKPNSPIRADHYTARQQEPPSAHAVGRRWRRYVLHGLRNNFLYLLTWRSCIRASQYNCKCRPTRCNYIALFIYS